MLVRWVRSWCGWQWLCAVAVTACDSKQTDESSTSLQPSSTPAATSAATLAVAGRLPAVSDSARDVRWLLRPPAKGAPRDASNPGTIEAVPVPRAPQTSPPTLARNSQPDGAAAEPTARALSRRAYPQNISDKPIPRIGDQPWLIANDWLKQHERQLQAPKRSQAKVVFLGDSITAAWRGAPAYREAFARYAPLNLGVAGDHTQNVLWRIEQGALEGLTPDVLVLMLGVNNLGGGFSAEATAAGVRAVIAAAKAKLPRTKILLLAILPARENPTAGLRSKIAATNALLAKLAEPGRVSFHDVGSVVLESDGTISKAVMRDFLHPTSEGYQRLTGSVEPLIAGLVGS